jgi:chromosome segregation ATPase
MTTITHKNSLIGELATIKGNIDKQLNALRSQQEQALADCSRIEQDLSDLAAKKAEHGSQIARHQKLIAGELGAQLASRERELLHTRGTSLEQEMQKAYRVASSAIADENSQIAALERMVKDIEQTELERSEQIEQLREALLKLRTQEGELLTTRETFDSRHSSAVLEACREQLTASADEVAKTEQALAQARERHQATQQEIAQRLSEWTALATDFLVEYGAFAEEHPEVELLRLKARLVELAEQHAGMISERVERALNFNVPLQALGRDGGRAGFQKQREDSARRYQATFGQEMASIDGYHNGPIESFAANCDALAQMLAQTETRRKTEQAKDLLEGQTYA